MNNTIATILKESRKSSRLSVKQTILQLKQHGIDIASKTLYGYESGLSMPNADVFIALYKIYHPDGPTDMSAQEPPGRANFLPDTPENISFSQKDLSFLADYKKLDAFGQEIVQQVLEHEKKRMQRNM